MNERRSNSFLIQGSGLRSLNDSWSRQNWITYPYGPRYTPQPGSNEISNILHFFPYRIQQGGRTGEVQETLQIKEVFSPFGGYHQSELHISSRNEIRTDERWKGKDLWYFWRDSYGFFWRDSRTFPVHQVRPHIQNSVCQNKNWRTTWDLRTYVNHEMCHVVQKRRSAPLAWETLLWYIAKDIRSRWSR